jgi:hypothetical protein
MRLHLIDGESLLWTLALPNLQWQQHALAIIAATLLFTIHGSTHFVADPGANDVGCVWGCEG